MNISVCMIVKNAQDELNDVLVKVKEFADEIIIVDTGSVDKTVDIAKKFTDKIYHFKWCDDFSSARNFSISKSSNAWILIVDSDEIITNFDRNNLEIFMKDNETKVGRIKRINPFEDEKQIKNYIERVNRFFNKKYFKYEGMIHEQIVKLDGSRYETENVEIDIYHKGYLNESLIKTDKLNRNINMLKTAIDKNPEDAYLYYQLGKSYYKIKEYLKSYGEFKTALRFTTNFKLEYVQDLVESYGYSLIKCSKYEESLDLEKYSRIYRQSPDFNFLMGNIYMNNAMFNQAITSFLNCTEKNGGKIEGITSFLPYYNIGIIYETLGDKHSAIKYYKLSEGFKSSRERNDLLIKNIIKNFEIEKQDIEILINEGNIEKALLYAKNLEAVKEDDIDIQIMISIIEILKGNYSAAVNILEDLYLSESTNMDIVYNLAFAYSQIGNNENALHYYKKALELSSDESEKAQIIGKMNEIM